MGCSRRFTPPPQTTYATFVVSPRSSIVLISTTPFSVRAVSKARSQIDATNRLSTPIATVTSRNASRMVICAIKSNEYLSLRQQRGSLPEAVLASFLLLARPPTAFPLKNYPE
jgi:hypothetical protein